MNALYTFAYIQRVTGMDLSIPVPLVSERVVDAVAEEVEAD